MAERKPVLLAVDDDQEVVRAVERDLRNRYARDFTVVAAGSGEDALEILRQLSSSGDPVALVVTDQRMPRMTGVELLAQSQPSRPTRSACSSPRTRTPRWRCARSTRSASTTT